MALLAAGAAAVLAVSLSAGHSRPPLPPAPTPATLTPAGDPFAYLPEREADYIARATAGEAYILYARSPGGVLATAARVSAFRPLIDAATAGTGIDPAILEAMVFVESAGRPEVIAGGDPADAAGLTQILAQTGQSILGMHIELPRSATLTARIDVAEATGKTALVARLEAERARIDQRFDPRQALAATVRYLKQAEHDLGRPDLAVESYHMGIGNLEGVLAAYDHGRPVPYAQLFFDTAPNRHAAAFDRLWSFADDSSLYYWRVLAALQIMDLYRTDRPALERLAALETMTGSAADVLHPPAQTKPFGDPRALAGAYAKRTIVPLPSNPAALGLAYSPSIGALAPRLGISAALYRGLRPVALDVLLEVATEVRALSGGYAPLIVTSAVSDARYQRLLGVSDPPAAAGWSFTIARRYVEPAQADAFQAVLDRLQALDVIAWERFPSEIEITVASDAARVLDGGP